MAGPLPVADTGSLPWPHALALPERCNDERRSTSTSSPVILTPSVNVLSVTPCSLGVYDHFLRRVVRGWMIADSARD